ncbi:hypothetical protein F5Y05DRAFT_412616 [Hypoxylon sp. FL0543]|nr:hypothetical protein F5Y05DRAFT_412616 [Hypoxylon sp. FL0543]
MADQPRRRRNRPDSKQMWDESERRSRHEPGARDKKDDRGRDREESYRERDRRYRSRSRSPRRDRHEKPRDRRDRDRDRDSERIRPRDDERPRPRADDRRDRGRDRNRGKDEPAPKGSGRDRSPRRSASPARSPPGKLERASHNSPLPTRPRPRDSKPDHGASLQFKVRKHDDEAIRGGKSSAGSKVLDTRGSPEDSEARRRRTETPNSQQGDAMDEDVEDEDIVVEDDGLSAMQAMMGFGGFGTTKGAHIPGNNVGAVRKEKKTEYRQYMNRVGGFNRPLSPTR